MKRIFFLFLTLPIYISSASQSDSCHLRISLLTCTPGEELYSSFGHSALRVFDYNSKTDLVYNYGTFDFYDPDFYEKFVKGQLLYFVSVDSLTSFLWEYEYFKRGVTEQVLNLDCIEKQNILAFLIENAKEENRYYRYDFNYDNCTTRLRDIIEKKTGNSLSAKNILPADNTTFRKLIHEYLNKDGQYWSKLGIDILLGSPLDKITTNREAMFLPDYLMMVFDSTTLNEKALISEKNILIPAFDLASKNSLFTPLLIFGFLLLIVTILSFLKANSVNKFFKIFDFCFFLLLGLLGILLLFMWFGTDHAMCKNNYNLLWALPLHLPASFFLFSKKEWIKKYFHLIFFYSLVLLAAWFLLPQQMNNALIPILGIIIVRSYFKAK